MANEIVPMYRKTKKTTPEGKPIWERWFTETIAEAVKIGGEDGSPTEKTIVQYVDEKIAALIGTAPETYDTIQEIAEYIKTHEEVSDALNQAIANRVPNTRKINGKPLSEDVMLSAADVSAIPESRKGVPDGVAELDSTGKVPEGQLPSLINAATVNGHTVKSDVPENAKFTDTVYTHPGSHAADMITQDETHRFVSDKEKQAWNAKANIYFASTFPEGAPEGSICFLIEE